MINVENPCDAVPMRIVRMYSAQSTEKNETENLTAAVNEVILNEVD